MLDSARSDALSWNVFDVVTEKTQTLQDLKLFYPTDIHHPPGWAYIAGDIISTVGHLTMPASGWYQHTIARWNQPLGRLGPGLICVSFQPPALWYIEPRRLESSEVGSADP